MLSPEEIAKRHRLLQFEWCPECGSKDHVTDRNSGEIVCGKRFWSENKIWYTL